MPLRSVLLVVIAGVAVAISGCTIGDGSTGADSADDVTTTSVVAGTAARPSGTAEKAVQAAPDAAGMTTGPDGNSYPARPGADEIQVDPEVFRNIGADGDGYFLQSPTGNIACAIYPNPASAGPVGCQAVTSVAPVDGPACTNADNDKYAVRIEPAGAVRFCTTQGIYTANEPAVLQYGEILTVGDASCVSREDGVSCLLVGCKAILMSRGANLTY